MLPVYSFRCQEFHGLERSHGAESCSECVTVILSVAVRFALALVCLDCGVYLVGRSDHFLLGLAGDPKMHNKAFICSRESSGMRGFMKTIQCVFAVLPQR